MKYALFPSLAFLCFALPGSAQIGKVEVGAAFTTIDMRDGNGEKPGGIAGRFTYNFHENASLDTEVAYFPQNGQGNFGETQVVAGLKAGKRWSKVGVFVKARPGFMHFGASSYRVFGNNEPTKFIADLGGVFEFYPSKRTMLRVDVGDTIIPWRNDRFANVTAPFGTRQPGTTHNLQTSIGFGYRF